ncbi:MAG TPA: ABC transporter permease subunit [Actinomycetota bacterium]
MNPRVRAVFRKELREYRRNRLIVFTMAGMPLLFLVILAGETFAIPDNVSPTTLRGAVGQALLFLQLIPVIIPTTVAAYAVIGEREQGTLEPVLTTPVTDRELLAGKAVAAVLPAVAITWALFAAYVGLAQVLAPRAVVDRIWTLEQVVAQLLLAPALAGFAIVVGFLVSLRSTDIRVAQQLAVLASLPVIALLSLATFRIVEPSVALYAVAAAATFGMDAAGWRLATRLFSRERLLTRYGGS